MKKNKNIPTISPLIFSVFKPPKLSSYDVVRHFKRHLPQGFGKIGHFGTLDPFASGVLMIGVAGAARLNDYIHEFMPKTYLAVGKLGIETPTGDYTSEISQRDESLYLNREIKSFSKEFIEDELRRKFIGKYLQAPHKYSAAKFMGKNLHEWAREGIEVKKEEVLREVYDIKVVKYAFPYLSVSVTVSSGTYVRTLFSDFANHLGTLGSLISLVRLSVGEESIKKAIYLKDWPKEREPSFFDKGRRVDEVLKFNSIILNNDQVDRFKNGAFLKLKDCPNLDKGKIHSQHYWMKDQEGKLLGLSFDNGEEIRPKINFYSMVQVES